MQDIDSLCVRVMTARTTNPSLNHAFTPPIGSVVRALGPRAPLPHGASTNGVSRRRWPFGYRLSHNRFRCRRPPPPSYLPQFHLFPKLDCVRVLADGGHGDSVTNTVSLHPLQVATYLDMQQDKAANGYCTKFKSIITSRGNSRYFR